MAVPFVLVILAYLLVPFSFFFTSNIFAMSFQGLVLVCYFMFCVKIWPAPERQRLRLWLPLGYPAVVLLTNLILFAIAVTRGYL